VYFTATNFGRENKRKGKEFDLPNVFALVLLGQVHDVCGGGLPGNLLLHGEKMCGMFLKRFHRKEWLAAKRRLNQ
jgi:hypothetical protein